MVIKLFYYNRDINIYIIKNIVVQPNKMICSSNKEESKISYICVHILLISD